MPRLGTLLADARKHAGYKTVYAMAKETGLPLTTIQEIENGGRSATIDTLERIMAAIGWKVVVTFEPRTKRRGRPTSA